MHKQLDIQVSDSWVQSDINHHIHPLVSLEEHELTGATFLRGGNGCFVEDTEGHRLLDGFSGLWCVNAGYGQQSIIDAGIRQLELLPYATGYFSFSSTVAAELAEKLTSLAPGHLNKVYFTLGGSDAVDSAIRFIQRYYNALGKTKKKHFISLERGYHGSSSLGAGLTALPVFHEGFQVPNQYQHYIPSHYRYRNIDAEDDQAIITQSIFQLRKKVEQLGGPEYVAAFFCEPVQGSGGVIVPPKGYLKAMSEACKALGILFVVDEVITGFGRTGTMFACEQEGVVPDMMTLAKGLTSGYAPMGALLISESIYQVLKAALGSQILGHGYTYSGHPVSAAIALATIEVYATQGLIQNSFNVGGYFEQQLQTLYEHPMVGDVRTAKMLAGVELVMNEKEKNKPAAHLNVPKLLFREAYRRGLIVRAFADGVIGLAPPLVCTYDDIDLLVSRLHSTLNALLDIKEIRNELN